MKLIYIIIGFLIAFGLIPLIVKFIFDCIFYDLLGFFKVPFWLCILFVVAVSYTLNPPPNPAKITDTRSPAYIEQYGRVSWEVDALPPEVLNKVLESAILEYLDEDEYNAQLAKEAKQKTEIKLFIDKY